MVRVTNTETGESCDYKGRMMVATNGTIFIKSGKETLWASGSEMYVVEVVEL